VLYGVCGGVAKGFCIIAPTTAFTGAIVAAHYFTGI